MPASPNIDNYYVGKGRVYWTPDGGVERDLGNVTEFEFTPSVEKLDHFSSQAGIRTKDRSVTMEKSATVRLVMDEWTVDNLQMALMGGVAAPDLDGNQAFDLLAVDELRGQVRFEGTNSVGPQVTITLPMVSFSPNAAINPITDEWGSIEISGEVLTSAGSFGTVTYREPA